MTRQHVHPIPNIRTAHAVGKRHGKPIILEIVARTMETHGHRFYRSENRVWLTGEVPADSLLRRFSV